MLSFDAFALLGRNRDLFVVDGIRIEGVKKVEEEAVLAKLEIKKGENLDTYTLNRDLKNIYSLKYFDHVEAHQKVENNKNILVFKVKEKPVISEIVFEGNDEVDDDDLKEVLKTKTYNILDINTIKNDIREILKLYEEKGFYLARINYELKSETQERTKLIFKVKEFDKIKVKKILLLGNKELSDNFLKGFMQTQEESFFSFMSGSGSFKEFNFKADIERMKFLYKSHGFLQINVGSPIVTVSEDKKWVFITININEGPKYSVNEIFFNGDLLFSDPELRKNLTLKPSEIYSEEKLRNDIQQLTEMYQDKGYAFANVLRTLEVVPGENKVNIVYSFEKGNIVHFGKIIVKGNSKTRDKVVRRELRIKEGIRYSGSLLRESKNAVSRLGFFEPGSVIFNTISPKGKDDVLDVIIDVKERQTGQISLGAGYSTTSQGFIQASIAQNNFRGLGQTLNLSFSVSQQQQVYNLGFTEPYFLDSKWTVGGDYFKSNSSAISSFSYERNGFDVRVGYPIFDYTRIFMTYKFEDTKINQLNNLTIDEEVENGVASGVETALVLDKRNNAFEPTDGHFARLSLEYVGLGGDKKWLKSSAEGRYYYPLIGDLVFRSRVQIQRISSLDDFAIPRTELFSMGGPRNMRGYGIEDIGPQIYQAPNGSTIPRFFNQGGQWSLLSQIELEHPLIKEAGLKWVLFTDIGNVYRDTFGEQGGDVDEANVDGLRWDYGFGFRWFSPIGVLRFEFGYPGKQIEYEGKEAGQQFHFDIGQIF